MPGLTMKTFAETGRLILRELMPSDDDGMFELDADPAVHKYLGNKPVKTIVESREVIAFIRQQYIDFGIGRWAVIEKLSGDFIGWAGLKFITDTVNKHTNYHDLGYRFINRYWGKGYATEAARAIVKYGFEELSLNEIYAITDIENLASKKVLQNSGLKYIEDFDLKGCPHSWLKIAADTRA
jgi:ribosomal-protein-alanine N-acetyltransferase